MKLKFRWFTTVWLVVVTGYTIFGVLQQDGKNVVIFFLWLWFILMCLDMLPNYISNEGGMESET